QATLTQSVQLAPAARGLSDPSLGMVAPTQPTPESYTARYNILKAPDFAPGCTATAPGFTGVAKYCALMAVIHCLASGVSWKSSSMARPGMTKIPRSAPS